jgi:hypothetical protein
MEVIADNFLGQQTGPYSEQDLQILEESEKQEQAQEQQDLIAGKFRSTDDLLKAYQELEKKLGSGNYEAPEESSVDETEAVEQEAPVLSQEDEQVILDSIGGQENFSAVQDWAKDSLNQEELEAYNREVNSGDYYRARNALQSLYYAYQDNTGYEPDLIGGKLSANSSDVFRSSQEVMAAMSDPRYLQDTAYTQDVQDKLIRSEVLGPRG